MTAHTQEAKKLPRPMIYDIALGEPPIGTQHDAITIAEHLAAHGVFMSTDDVEYPSPGHGVTVTPDHHLLLWTAAARTAIDDALSTYTPATVHPPTHRPYTLALPPLPDGATRHNAAALHAHLVSKGVNLHDGVSVTADGKAVIIAESDPMHAMRDYAHVPVPGTREAMEAELAKMDISDAMKDFLRRYTRVRS